ncbi:Usp39 [Symbiodinium sp. KB8]|nr:Usp39 [Symbiodinium sp. KB8]
MKRVKLEDPRAEEEELPGKLQRTAASGDNASGVRTEHRKCPYLDTINRHVLDFDFDKACSVTLSRHNVYACLVCGKFFQGRGRHTPAYTHALQASHYVFMNLRDARIWCLPDNYEVVDSSLRDVQYALDPSFTDAEIAAIDGNTALATDLQGIKYLPGFVGLNNLKKTDYLNVVVHVLCHVNPLRDFFLKK